MDAEPTPAQALRASVNSAGSQSALARICGVTQAAVWKWLDGGKHLPAEHVLKVERHTGVSRYLLRPDIYPASNVAASGDLPAEVAPVASNTSRAFDRDRA